MVALVVQTCVTTAMLYSEGTERAHRGIVRLLLGHPIGKGETDLVMSMASFSTAEGGRESSGTCLFFLNLEGRRSPS
jgi:hypothetical protein